MNPFRELGLNRSATVDEVKRAYAARLKKTRPEDDAEGFQRLREAFDSALAMARQREYEALLPQSEDDSEDDADATRASAVSNDPDFAVSEAQSAIVLPDWDEEDVVERVEPTFEEETGFDFDRFIGEMQVAADEDLPSFQRWLETHPELYSLTLKEQLAWPLMSHLAEAERPLLPKWLGAIVSFLGLDTVGSRHFHLDHLVEEARQHAEAYWRPDAIAFQLSSPKARLLDRVAFRQLQKPGGFASRAALMLTPGIPGKLAQLSEAIQLAHTRSQRRVANTETLAFWATRLRTAELVQFSFLVLVSIGIGAWLGNVWLGIPCVVVVGAIWWSIAAHIATPRPGDLALDAPAPQRETSSGFNWRWIWVLIVLGNLARALMNH